MDTLRWFPPGLEAAIERLKICNFPMIDMSVDSREPLPLMPYGVRFSPLLSDRTIKPSPKLIAAPEPPFDRGPTVKVTQHLVRIGEKTYRHTSLRPGEWEECGFYWSGELPYDDPAFTDSQSDIAPAEWVGAA